MVTICPTDVLLSWLQIRAVLLTTQDKGCRSDPLVSGLQTFLFLDKFRNLSGGFSGGSVVKSLPAIQETWVLSLGQGDLLWEGNGNLLQYPCLRNPMDRGAWWATVLGVTGSWTRLRNWAKTFEDTEALVGSGGGGVGREKQVSTKPLLLQQLRGSPWLERGCPGGVKRCPQWARSSLESSPRSPGPPAGGSNLCCWLLTYNSVLFISKIRRQCNSDTL